MAQLEPLSRPTIWAPELTLEEKAALLQGAGMETRTYPHHDIPPLRMADGPTGVRNHQHNSTAFPAGICLAASWDEALMAEVAGAIADEFAAVGRRVILGPTLDILRNPWYGRSFEGYGEDPLLTGRMGVAYIRAVQARGLMACAKHFVCNNQETGKHAFDQVVDARALHEIYLRPFRMAVQEADVGGIMGAYNRVNGHFCCEHRELLEDILRRMLGFEGVVISDWGGVYDGPKAFMAGCDLEMPDGRLYKEADLPAMAARDPQARAMLDAMAARVLHTVDKWERRRPALQPDPARLQAPATRALARRAAPEGMVLLANKDATLPLDATKLRRVAVMGPGATRMRVGGGGSSEVFMGPLKTPLDALRELLGETVEVVHAEGAFLDTDASPVSGLQLRTGPEASAPNGLHAAYYSNDNWEGAPVLERIDSKIRWDWHTDGPDKRVGARYSVRWTGFFVPEQDGEHDFRMIASSQMRCAGRVVFDGQVLVDTAAEVPLHGGFKRRLRLQAGRAYPLEVTFRNELGFSRVHLTSRHVPSRMTGQAVDLAREADAAIIFVGFSKDCESEGRDRPMLALPEDQDALIREVAAVNPRTVVVLNAGGAVLPGAWSRDAHAVLLAWYPGIEGAAAMADVLFGRASPGGRLPCTFPLRIEDCRAAHGFPPSDGVIRYTEGVFVGYRDYDHKSAEVLYPFGFGLSYTRFEFSDMALWIEGREDKARVRLACTVTNVGQRAGSEVVQVYSGPLASRPLRPVRELQAFTRVRLEPGEQRRVELFFPISQLAIYEPAAESWNLHAGDYKVEAGASSRDIRLGGIVSVGARRGCGEL